MALQAAGRAPGTITVHRHYLEQLRKAHRTPWRVTTAQLRELLAEPGWSPETRKSCRTVLRGFYKWGHGEGLIADDPARGLLPIRVPPAAARPTPEYLVRRLLEHEDPRLGLMVMLAALAGLRRAEIARVHADHLLGDVLVVLGKGSKVRMVPILDERLLERLQGLTGYAFPSQHGEHLTPGHVGVLLSRALPAGWTGHTLRHRMATQAYEGTGDLLAVMTVLGHSRPETTQRYVRLEDRRLRAALSAALVA